MFKRSQFYSSLLVAFLFLPTLTQAQNFKPSNNTFIHADKRFSSPEKAKALARAPEKSICTKMMSELECQVFQLTNKTRQAHELKPLKFYKNCFELARAHSKYMARLSSSGKSLEASVNHDLFKERVKKFKVASRKTTENVAGGDYRKPEDLIKSWMTSEGHKTNLLDSQVSGMGLAVANNKKGQQFWTQCFSAL